MLKVIRLSFRNKIFLASVLIFSISIWINTSSYGQASTPAKSVSSASTERLKWFNDARLGMFIHWGPYSVAARGEWVRNREMIPQDEYTEKYVNNLTGEKFDPVAIAKLAKQAGAKYIVLTAKHHDGFVLWNTKTTPFNAMNLGPKRDIVAEYIKAARAEGLKVGLYFSITDWSHSDFPTPYARVYPGKEWKSQEAIDRFMEYSHSQLRELMTNYGKIDLLWYDGGLKDTPGNKENKYSVNDWVYKVQPDIVINDRGGAPNDYSTSEQKVTAAVRSWEACFTLNNSWGYHAGDNNYKTVKDVIKTLLNTSSQGGNLLINIGPRADGSVPQESVEILQKLGKWLKENDEFLPSSERTGYSWNNTAEMNIKDNKIYLHFLNSPARGEFMMPDFSNKILSIKYLATGKPVEFRQEGNKVFMKNLKISDSDDYVTTIVMEAEGKPRYFLKQMRDEI